MKPSFSCVCASLRLLLLSLCARSSKLRIVSSSAISPFPLKERAAFVVELAGGGLRLGRSSPRASRSSSGSNFSLRRRQQNAANSPKASGEKSGARQQERPRPRAAAAPVTRDPRREWGRDGDAPLLARLSLAGRNRCAAPGSRAPASHASRASRAAESRRC